MTTASGSKGQVQRGILGKRGRRGRESYALMRGSLLDPTVRAYQVGHQIGIESGLVRRRATASSARPSHVRLETKQPR